MEETELQRRVNLAKDYIGPCMCDNGIISFKNNGKQVVGNPLVSYRGPTTKAVRRTMADAGFIPSDDDKKFNLMWGNPQPKEYMKMLSPGQLIAHLAGQYCLTRKDGLGNTIEDACRVNPAFRIIPKSFALPEYLYQYQLYSQRNPGYYVIKLANAARGEGVKIIHSSTDIKPKKSAVIQEYITNPLLINGKKFDIRLYVVVTFVEPLIAYVYFDGLGRFATTDYAKPQKNNMNDQKIHLTNYSVNKETEYEINEYKWSFLDVISYIDKNYTDLQKAVIMKDIKYKKENVMSSRQSSRNSCSSVNSLNLNEKSNDKIQIQEKIRASSQITAFPPKHSSKNNQKIKEILLESSKQIADQNETQTQSSKSAGQIAYENIMHVIKLALIAAEPRLVADSNNLGLNSLPRRQFGFFGFDVMLLSDLSAKIIEVNVNPSTATEHKIDEQLKYAMLRDMFHLVGIPCVTQSKSGKIETFTMSENQGQRKYDAKSQLLSQVLKENEKKFGHYKDKDIKMTKSVEYKNFSRYEKLLADQLQQEDDRRGGFQRILPDPEYCQYFLQERYLNILFSKQIIKE